MSAAPGRGAAPPQAGPTGEGVARRGAPFMAIASSSSASHKAQRVALVADIGGTNARLAIADLDTLELTNAVSLRREGFPSLEAVAESYLKGVAGRPSAAAIAVAAPVVGDTIKLTNSPWSFRRDELRTALGLDQLL